MGTALALASVSAWGVENSHQILDTALEEDDHRWLEASPRAALVVAILRPIAYTMRALFRSVTQRSDERQAAPWDTFVTDLGVALLSTSSMGAAQDQLRSSPISRPRAISRTRPRPLRAALRQAELPCRSKPAKPYRPARSRPDWDKQKCKREAATG